GWGRFLVHQAGVAECGNPVSIEDSTVCPSQILISRSFDNVTSKQIITALKRQLNPRSKCRDSHNTCSLKQSERERRGAVQFARKCRRLAHIHECRVVLRAQPAEVINR